MSPRVASGLARAAAVLPAIVVAAALGPALVGDAGAAGLEQVLRRESSVLRTLEGLARDVVVSERKLDDLRHEREQVAYQIEESNRKIEALDRRAAERRRHIRLRARILYKLSRGGFIRLLLDRSDGNSLMRRLSATRLILRRDAGELRLYRRSLARLERERGALKRRQTALVRLETRLRRRRDALAASRRAQRRVLAQLRRSRRAQARLTRELDRQEQRLLRRIEALRYRVTIAGGFGALRGRLPRPVGGPVVGVFGRAVDQRRGGLEVLRRGITFRSFRRANVRAVSAGVVRIAGPMSGYGQLVLVEHRGGFFTLYGFLSATRVEVGQRVKLGTIVGRAGRDPLTARSAVYFEIRSGQRPLDPAAWFRR